MSCLRLLLDCVFAVQNTVRDSFLHLHRIVGVSLIRQKLLAASSHNTCRDGVLGLKKRVINGLKID